MSVITVWVTQCLCHRRHAVMWGAFEASSETRDFLPEQVIRECGYEVQTKMEEAIECGDVSGICKMCGSVDLTYETAETDFASLQQAIDTFRSPEVLAAFTDHYYTTRKPLP